MPAKLWLPSGFIALLDEIERRTPDEERVSEPNSSDLFREAEAQPAGLRRDYITSRAQMRAALEAGIGSLHSFFDKRSEAETSVREDLFLNRLESATIEEDGEISRIDSQWYLAPEASETMKSGTKNGRPVVLIPSGWNKNALTSKAASVSKVSDESKAREYLVERMTKSPKKPPDMTNKALFADAKKQCPNLSERAFERAKAAAIEATGAVDWKAPGK